MSELASTIGAIGSIAAAMILVVGGAFAYRVQKQTDRRENLTTKRQSVYRDLLVSISQSISSNGPTSDEAYRTSKQETFVYGSDQVVKALKTLSDQLEGRSASTRESQLTAYAELVHAMRQDSFEKSALTKAELAKLTPFN